MLQRLLLRTCTLQCCFRLYFLCLLIPVDSHHIHDSVLPFTHFILLWSVGHSYLSLNPVKLIIFLKNTVSHTIVLPASLFFAVYLNILKALDFCPKNTPRFSSLLNHKCRKLPFSTIWSSVIDQYLFQWTSSRTSPYFLSPSFSEKTPCASSDDTIFSNTRF